LQAAGISQEQVSKATFLRGQGCTHCHQTGYRGRLGIFEMLKMNAAIREMTFNREPTQQIRRIARKNHMRTLLEDAIQKVLKGITTLEEVLSTCHHETQEKDK
jgi:type IV pilus assembly protein PilB